MYRTHVCFPTLELQYVTCGSVVTLQHFTSKFRLHSHDVKYGGGSGQLSVTGFKEQGDVNNYWIVREGYGAAPCEGFFLFLFSFFFSFFLFFLFFFLSFFFSL